MYRSQNLVPILGSVSQSLTAVETFEGEDSKQEVNHHLTAADEHNSINCSEKSTCIWFHLLEIMLNTNNGNNVKCTHSLWTYNTLKVRELTFKLIKSKSNKFIMLQKNYILK